VPIRFVFAACLLALLAVADSPARSQNPQTPETSTLQVTSRLVILDVVVVDSKGKPVTNLDR
jgi:cytochrome oxidase Cu insertion factor (SCO1/SenC/PrrC family)